MRRRVLFLAVLITLAAAAAAPAQQADTTLRPVAQDSAKGGVSPTGAMLRSLVIPGWGQFSAGAYTRGIIFAAGDGAAWYMLLKTISRLNDVRDRESGRVSVVSDSLRTLMAQDTALARVLSDSAAFAARVGEDPDVRGARALINSREEQRQDWIAYTLFWTFAAGVDAFVAAHLADFPATINVRPSAGGGMQLQFHVPTRRRP